MNGQQDIIMYVERVAPEKGWLTARLTIPTIIILVTMSLTGPDFAIWSDNGYFTGSYGFQQWTAIARTRSDRAKHIDTIVSATKDAWTWSPVINHLDHCLSESLHVTNPVKKSAFVTTQ